jgi:hypothetical protein
MILRGLLERSLGGFVCLRGNAPLGLLADISSTDPSYQRDLLKDHEKEIVRFLGNKEYLFFPEVILACILQYDFKKPKAKSGYDPLAEILAGRSFYSNVDKIRVAVRSLTFEGTADLRNPQHLRVVSLSVPENLLVGRGQRPFFRIDGNHRLSAASKKPEFRDLPTPFCILLFQDDRTSKQHSKTIFHNINSKAIPLTPEENLRIILDDEALFPDHVLKDPSVFGWEYFLARRLAKTIQDGYLDAIKHLLADKRAILVRLFRFLLDRKAIDEKESALEKVLGCVKKVNDVYAGDDSLKTNACPGLLVAFAYFCLTDGNDHRLEPFRCWVKGNHLAGVKSMKMDAETLIEVFEKVHLARERTVFVSMQFGDATNATYETIEKVIAQVNAKCRPPIEIRPVRIDKLNKGHSYAITDEILEMLASSGLLIADLTEGNKNVYHEVGFLMGLNRGKGRQQDNFVLIVRDRGKKRLAEDVGFNLADIQQIRFKETIDLERELTKTIRAYYQLGDENGP